MHGVMLSTIHVEHNGGKPIFCPSDDVTINSDFLVENMERVVRERPASKTTFWPVVALAALREAFPCK
jgi:hypothetical protein